MSLLINESYANPSRPLWATAGSGTGLLPAGMVMGWATATPPIGWLICNGAQVSRTTYAELFALIGTTYGVGDNLTTFNLPNLSGRVLRASGGIGGYVLGASGGQDSVTLNANQLPQHTHPVQITDPGHTHNVTLTGLFNNGDTGSGVVYVGQSLGGLAGDRTTDPGAATQSFTGITALAQNNASPNNTVDVRDPYQVLNYIIKYTSSNL